MWRSLKARIAWTLGCRPGNVDKSPPNAVTLLPSFSLFPFLMFLHYHTTHTESDRQTMRAEGLSRRRPHVHCYADPGMLVLARPLLGNQFSYLREKIGKVNNEVSSAVGKSKTVLTIAKEEAVAAKVESMLGRMGTERFSGRLKDIFEEWHD